MYAISPTGTLIIGTLERVEARGEIELSSFKYQPDGTLDFKIDGSEVFMESMRPQKNEAGRILFLDRDGNEWTEDEIRLVGRETALLLNKTEA